MKSCLKRRHGDTSSVFTHNKIRIMKISVNINFDLSALDIAHLTVIGLENSSREIQSIARVNAPYDTGKLKQGIAVEKNNDTARI
jgi:hypothetical protein